MKLNLGCGGTYKKGYLNVDAFDSTIADQLMSATDLQLEDNTVDEVYASQVIEHLGIVGSIYALSECFRVLKPQKPLIIETPNLQKSSEIYVNGNREDRKNILPWIHGVDISGMVHRFCYPEDLLEETLQKLGFINIKKEFIEPDPYEPTLKMICEKPEKHQSFQMITRVRKTLLHQQLVNVDDQLTALEQEQLLEWFTKKLADFFYTTDHTLIKEIVINGGVQSPLITQTLVDELQTQKVLSEEEIQEYKRVLSFLTEMNFPTVLLHLLKQTSGFVGEQDKLFNTTYSLGQKTIEKLLHPEKEDKTVDMLRQTATEISPEENIIFFSSKLFMLKANRLFSRGIKAFVVSNYKNSIALFRESLRLYRDQILTYWNLARLLQMQGNMKEALNHYENAMKLLDILEYGEKKQQIKQALTHEMNQHTPEKWSTPITSIHEI